MHSHTSRRLSHHERLSRSNAATNTSMMDLSDDVTYRSKKRQLQRSKRKTDQLTSIYMEHRDARSERLRTILHGASKSGGDGCVSEHYKSKSSIEKHIEEMEDKEADLLRSVRRASMKKGQENMLIEDIRELVTFRKELSAMCQAELRRLRAAMIRQQEATTEEVPISLPPSSLPLFLSLSFSLSLSLSLCCCSTLEKKYVLFLFRFLISSSPLSTSDDYLFLLLSFRCLRSLLSLPPLFPPFPSLPLVLCNRVQKSL